jgi:hypothetical protein
MVSAACKCKHRCHESQDEPDSAVSFRDCARGSTARVSWGWLTSRAGAELILLHEGVSRSNSPVVNSYGSASVLKYAGDGVPATFWY